MNTTKKTMVLHGDGVHDDTAALQAYLNGEATLIFPDGSPFDGRGSVCKISRTLQASSDAEAAGREFFQSHHEANGSRGLHGFQAGDWGGYVVYTHDHRLEPVPARQRNR